MNLNDAVCAVVTGGASGLGEAVTRALATRGVKVALLDRNEVRGRLVADEIGGAFLKTDVGDPASVAAAFEAARLAHGQERVLVCCAGVAPGARTVGLDRTSGEIKQHPASLFRTVVDVNLLGTFHCVAESAAGMARLDPLEDGERGAIVCTASIAAYEGQIGQAAYAASKAAIVGMTLPIARDLMSFAIRINTILPGLFETPLMNSLPESARESLAQAVPFPKRLGRAEEYAELALFLLEQGYMNGESIRMDGAMRLAPR